MIYLTASRAMFPLINKCKQSQLTLDIQLDMFDRVVLPILDDGCEIWGPEMSDIGVTLQLRFYKRSSK